MSCMWFIWKGKASIVVKIIMKDRYFQYLISGFSAKLQQSRQCDIGIVKYTNEKRQSRGRHRLFCHKPLWTQGGIREHWGAIPDKSSRWQQAHTNPSRHQAEFPGASVLRVPSLFLSSNCHYLCPVNLSYRRGTLKWKRMETHPWAPYMPRVVLHL